VYGSGATAHNVIAEYLIRGGRYERGREVILKGRLDYNWENGGE
jgi:hypothetical protein